MSSELPRCAWPGSDSHLLRYHDEEWGVPKLDDRDQFEHMVMEIFQAGLSWLTILKRREAFRAAFADFNPSRVAMFKEPDVERLMGDPGIIRNRAKIQAAICNAGLFCHLSLEFGSFYNFARQFGTYRSRGLTETVQIPPFTAEAVTMSKELKRRGFKFLGPTVCYAHLQSVGIVNDHLVSCYRYETIESMRNASKSA